ncbi:glutamine amidotransferase [Sorangium sp. So ce1389]|uniref:glutamine amidotransferase n=1 Tax=Sorangium sp. So ce1389 TaxID=3133336 RepID=UPI003F5F7417
MTQSLAPSGDLSSPVVAVACVVAALSLGLLVLELFRARGRAAAGSGGAPARAALGTILTGALAVLALLAAILRPVAVTSRGSLVGPKVVVLVDGSRSMDLPGLAGTRREAADRALAELGKRADVRLSRYVFGEGAPVPADGRTAGEGAGATPAPGGSAAAAAAPAGSAAAPAERGDAGAQASPGAAAPFVSARPHRRSDLSAALEALARAADERPSAFVVVSDGRLDRPGPEDTAAATRAALEGLDVPVHTVAVATEAVRDAGVRAVRTSGAAVAHQPLSLRIDIGCSGGLACDAVPVVARELREQGAPTTLATGTAHVDEGGVGTVELGVTLDRAGTRILEVAIQSPQGDELPENDVRYITLDVARDRIRVLHVAGRPTYDVRALRMWLKADASVDVVAFFILRTPGDEVNAASDELALIPFPVDELFSVHLSSFDAVVLQDFDAAPYGLTKHLPALAQYVDKGGGLIMVGGPNAFVQGNYARTRLARVLPVDLDIGRAPVVDLGAFVPRITAAGRAAPVLAPLLALIGDEMPEMPGTNVVGDPLPGATVLMTHPTRTTASGAPMPVLSLGEHESGRTIALTLDGSHRLLFSAFASSSAGRAHGAFWDALLGWLMRDPRFEPAAIEPRGGCLAGEETTLVLRPLAGQGGEARVTIARLGSGAVVRTLKARVGDGGEPVELAAGRFEPGGYAATVEIVPADAASAVAAVGAGDADDRGGDQKRATTRRDFACERGGDEWADPRPDVARLEEIARATGGTSVLPPGAGSLPLPAATQVAAERHVAPLLPPWAWTLAAAVALGAHWIVRRRGGLA